MALLWAAPSFSLTNAPFKQEAVSAWGQPHCSAQAWQQLRPGGIRQAQAQVHILRVEARRRLRAVPIGTTDASQESAIDEPVGGAVVGTVTSVNKDTFWPIVKAAGDKLVVLDMYTQWCGPCKLIAPQLEELSRKYTDVLFLKLDCNQDNKPLAKELGVRVVPTFKLLKQSQIVSEVAGAKYKELLAAIDAARTSG